MSKRPNEPITDLPGDELFAIVQEIQSSPLSTKNRQFTFERKYAAFAERYPKLFQGACAGQMDLQQFREMLRLRNRVQSNKMSLYDASAIVGQKLYDCYVKPMIDRSPPPQNDDDASQP